MMDIIYPFINRKIKFTFKYIHPLIILILFFSGCRNDNDKKLPFLGNKVIQEGDTLYHKVADFQFTDQDSLVVTNEDFNNKIYVADFFFTSCPTICPTMKSQMLRVYETFKDNEEVMILSHTIDTKYDTIPLLKSYSERLGVSSPKWRFVTGNQEDIYEIGQESYMVTTGEDKFSPGGYMHSGAFILVDKERRIRGVYDGTKEEQINQLIRDIPTLLKEYEVH